MPPPSRRFLAGMAQPGLEAAGIRSANSTSRKDRRALLVVYGGNTCKPSRRR